MTISSLDKYQIGWICSNPIVAATAHQMLDEEYGPLDEQDELDTNSYTLGRVGKHFVVIVCVGGQGRGTTPATATAIHMMRTFPALRTALAISTGGAIPSPEDDIRLGDVVVSYPTDECGGILQFDMGPIRNDATVQRTVYLDHPPKVLLAAADLMRSATLRNAPLYPAYVAETAQMTAHTEQNFQSPGKEHDRLFRVEPEHSPDASHSGESLPESEVTREEREDTEPQIFYGVIASGNAVIEHGPTRERYGKETGALCLETLSAGVIQDLPCLAICGVSNYADSCKNKDWEGYAALAAAAYAKELLAYVPSRQLPRPSLLAANSARVMGEEEPKQVTDALPLRTQGEWLKITKAPTFGSEDYVKAGAVSHPKERLLHTLFDWVE